MGISRHAETCCALLSVISSVISWCRLHMNTRAHVGVERFCWKLTDQIWRLYNHCFWSHCASDGVTADSDRGDPVCICFSLLFRIRGHFSFHIWIGTGFRYFSEPFLNVRNLWNRGIGNLQIFFLLLFFTFNRVRFVLRVCKQAALCRCFTNVWSDWRESRGYLPRDSCKGIQSLRTLLLGSVVSLRGANPPYFIGLFIEIFFGDRISIVEMFSSESRGSIFFPSTEFQLIQC